MNQARAVLEVTAGVIPNQPMPELTKRWAITSEEWATVNVPLDEDATPEQQYAPHPASVLLAERQAQAQGYAALLMLQPDRYNWVRVDWLWL
jgi:hypothetical protein